MHVYMDMCAGVCMNVCMCVCVYVKKLLILQERLLTAGIASLLTPHISDDSYVFPIIREVDAV